jgi:hypothetical protein
MAVSNKPSCDRRSIESSGLKSRLVLTTEDTKDTKQRFYERMSSGPVSFEEFAHAVDWDGVC